MTPIIHTNSDINTKFLSCQHIQNFVDIFDIITLIGSIKSPRKDNSKPKIK